VQCQGEEDTRRLKLAAVAQFSLTGPPIIYYGTELGMSQRRDVTTSQGNTHDYEARRPMIWDDRQNSELLAFYQRLIAVRRQHPALVYGERLPLVVGDAAGIYAYARSYGDDQLIVVLNNFPTPHRVTVPVGKAEVLDGRSLHDLLLSGDAKEKNQLVQDGEIVLQMAPYQAVILALLQSSN
jgi:cyclomaltodextrinase